METLYDLSPHKQITENFRCNVVKVTDGDTIRVRWTERDFDFPIRFLGIDAPELNMKGGKESKEWLENVILDQDVDILIDSNNRVGKFGRLLGTIFFNGMDINMDSVRMMMSAPFGRRREGELPDLNKELNIEKWF